MIKGFLILISVTYIIYSCNNRNKHIKGDLIKMIGSKIDLIDTLSIYSIDKGLYKEDAPPQMKIVSYIDGSCGSCLYSLAGWKECIISNEFKNVSFRLYVKTYNFNQLVLTLEEIDFPHPIIVDFKNHFFNQNNIHNEFIYQTFLVDKDNKILLVGNPLLNREIKKLYLETICQ
jgi:hypothetical protein